MITLDSQGIVQVLSWSWCNDQKANNYRYFKCFFFRHFNAIFSDNRDMIIPLDGWRAFELSGDF